MGLITKEVEVGLGGKNIRWYENKGYELPKRQNKKGKLVIDNKAKIIVKVEDLMPNSEVIIETTCDYCGSLMPPMPWKDYIYRKENCVIKNDCCMACSGIKTKEANLINYGVENTSQLPEVTEKRRKTFIERFGEDHPMKTKEIQDKIKQTNMDRYGVDNVFKLPETIEKSRITFKEKYDVDWITQSSEMKEKTKKTNLDRYGVECILSSEEYQERIKQTNLDKYGVEYYSQTDEFKTRYKQTMIVNYGVDSVFKVPEIIERRNQTNIKRYNFIYPMQNAEIRKKQRESVYKSGKVASSKQQRYIHQLLEGELNHHANNKCFVDIGFIEEKIYIEVDCSGHRLGIVHGQISEHDFEEKEKRRSYGLIKSGWKEIRIISLKDLLPSDEVLLDILKYARELFVENGFHRVVFDIDNNKIFTSKWKINCDFGKLRSLRNMDI